MDQLLALRARAFIHRVGDFGAKQRVGLGSPLGILHDRLPEPADLRLHRRELRRSIPFQLLQLFRGFPVRALRKQDKLQKQTQKQQDHQQNKFYQFHLFSSIPPIPGRACCRPGCTVHILIPAQKAGEFSPAL